MNYKIETVNWEFTKQCNLNCIHCIGDYGKPDENELDILQQIKVVDKLIELGCKSISFTGGEPLCSNSFRKIVNYSYDKNLTLSLITNATLLEPNDDFYRKFQLIGISIDDDFIRGSKNTENTLLKIEKLVNLQYNISVYISVYKNNLETLSKLITQLQNIGVDNFGIKNIRINDIVPRGRAKINEELLMTNRNGTQEIINSIKQIVNNHSRNELYIELKNCDADYKNIFIDSTGLVFGCTEIYQNSLSKNIGNILDLNSEIISKYQVENHNNLDCCYTMFANNEFTVCICNGKKCPLI